MQSSLKYLAGVNVNDLICSLYTLSEFHSVFKKFNLKTGGKFSEIRTCYFLEEKENFNKFRKLLNSRALRRFAVILLNPFLKEGHLSYSSILKNEKEISNEISLLKKYFRKFKYNYLKYFYYQEKNLDIIITPQELNLCALKSLYLLAGI